jgi:hypothetical protein
MAAEHVDRDPAALQAGGAAVNNPHHGRAGFSPPALSVCLCEQTVQIATTFETN